MIPTQVQQVQFNVTGVEGVAGPLFLSGSLFLPPTVPSGHRVQVLDLHPGGTYTRAYWHLEVPGFPPESYSFARYAAERGCIVVATDHLGTGESSRPPNGRALTLGALARARAAASEVLRAQLAAGTLSGQLPPSKISSSSG